MSQLEAAFEKRFPTGANIAIQLNTPIDRFHVTVLFGPSGAGKSTVLRCLAGLERPTQGYIRFGNEHWFGRSEFRSPQQRGIGMMFQDYALFPHLTVEHNVSFGLRRSDPADRDKRVRDLLQLFQIEDLAKRYPSQLSGGQRQRVGLARAIATRPKLLLLDEPLSALDAVLRESMRGELRRTLSSIGVPVYVVTHDRAEALALGDDIVVMYDGELKQSGPIESVFSNPVDSDVARILGVETVAQGEVIGCEKDLVRVRVGTCELVSASGSLAEMASIDRVAICIRADEVLVMRSQHEGLSVRNQIASTVTWIVHEGTLVRVGLDAGFPLTALVTRSAYEELNLKVGEAVVAAIKAQSIRMLVK